MQAIPIFGPTAGQAEGQARVDTAPPRGGGDFQAIFGGGSDGGDAARSRPDGTASREGSAGHGAGAAKTRPAGAEPSSDSPQIEGGDQSRPSADQTDREAGRRGDALATGTFFGVEPVRIGSVSPMIGAGGNSAAGSDGLPAWSGSDMLRGATVFGSAPGLVRLAVTQSADAASLASLAEQFGAGPDGLFGVVLPEAQGADAAMPGSIASAPTAEEIDVAAGNSSPDVGTDRSKSSEWATSSEIAWTGETTAFVAVQSPQVIPKPGPKEVRAEALPAASTDARLAGRNGRDASENSAHGAERHIGAAPGVATGRVSPYGRVPVVNLALGAFDNGRHAALRLPGADEANPEDVPENAKRGQVRATGAPTAAGLAMPKAGDDVDGKALPMTERLDGRAGQGVQAMSPAAPRASLPADPGGLIAGPLALDAGGEALARGNSAARPAHISANALQLGVTELADGVKATGAARPLGELDPTAERAGRTGQAVAPAGEPAGPLLQADVTRAYWAASFGRERATPGTGTIPDDDTKGARGAAAAKQEINDTGKAAQAAGHGQAQQAPTLFATGAPMAGDRMEPTNRAIAPVPRGDGWRRAEPAETTTPANGASAREASATVEPVRGQPIAAPQPWRQATTAPQGVIASAEAGSPVSLLLAHEPGGRAGANLAPPPLNAAVAGAQQIADSAAVARTVPGTGVRDDEPRHARMAWAEDAATMDARSPQVTPRVPASSTTLMTPTAHVYGTAPTTALERVAPSLAEAGGESTESESREFRAEPAREITAAGHAGAPVSHHPAQATEMRVMRHVAHQLVDVARQAPERPIEVFLNPEELGRVRMTLHVGDGGIAVNLTAERGETLDLMRRHLETLLQEFRSLGYRDISFSFGGSGPDPRGEGNRKAEPGRILIGPATEEGDKPAQPSARGTQAHGGVDLRL